MIESSIGNNKTLTGTIYGKYSHPFGIIFNQSNIEVEKYIKIAF